MTYFSRSRKELWTKGMTSGHIQYVKSLTADCDYDTILAKVSQVGAACHTGNPTCFFNEIVKKEYVEKNPLKVLEDVYEIILDRKAHPKEGSYTNYLFDKGIDKILKKVGEEATEIVIAAKNPDPEEVKYEISDFLYHMMVLMAEEESHGRISHRNFPSGKAAAKGLYGCSARGCDGVCDLCPHRRAREDDSSAGTLLFRVLEVFNYTFCPATCSLS